LFALVTAILDHDAGDPDSPAGRVLGPPPFLLQAEIESGPLRIPPEAVANRPGWNLQTADALQSLADARGTPVYYAVITDLIIRGDVATGVFGSDIRVPSRERDVVVLCCELATDEYQRTGRGWKFVKRIRVVAS